MKDTCDDHVPCMITRQKGQPVVMMSLDDYNSLQETLYLLSTPKNAHRLAESIHAIEKGNALMKPLAE